MRGALLTFNIAQKLKWFFVVFLALLVLTPTFARAESCCIPLGGGGCRAVGSDSDCEPTETPSGGTPCTQLPACGGAEPADEQEFFQQGLRGAGGLVNIFGERAGFPTNAPREPEVIIGQFIQGAILVIGVVFGILIIYGGYLWMTARGNEDQAKKAMDILRTTVIGFILVIAAYSITNFVVDRIITAAFTP